ncbi:esterase-like activity of phytase family protein [Herbaspirillum sp. 1130]|uniref:esterase-like activity of phytase family protein n=1 Tax=Herbaspirillum sp. 1130 TaxID=2806562 RepID=UPI001B58A5F5|nr:esterase-like activity of phytase family protein [Herbaspirillum sp. 1130]MBP1313358.1 hypothetical protein [Herbaspirillum sp. 1130]
MKNFPVSRESCFVMRWAVAELQPFLFMRSLPLPVFLMRTRLVWLACLLAFWLGGCAVNPDQSTPTKSLVGSLRLLGEQRIALNAPFMGTVIGGLSGIDYDPRSDTWVAESDDRSEVSPARFYTLKLRYDLQGFHALQVDAVTLLRQADGSLYPDAREAAVRGGDIPDLESIRVDPLDGSLWYSSEGNRPKKMSPFVRRADRDGSYLSQFPTGTMFQVRPDQPLGPRDNLSFEGLSFSPDGQTLWLGMEAPLYQDGEVPTLEHGALARITHYRRDGTIIAQYAYSLDAIAHAPGGRYADNGLSELLAVDAHHLLALERSGVQGSDGVFRFHIRLYEMDISNATDIAAMPALAGQCCIRPAGKRLILDFDTLPLAKIDNLEGVSWGPRLANGHDSLVFISDNNFNASQVTQLLAFEVIPP